MIDLNTELQTVLRAVKKNIDVAGQELSAEQMNRLKDAVEEAEDVGEILTPAPLQGIIDELEQAAYPLAEALMHNLASNTVRNRTVEDVLGKEQ
jgi:hypothetical protein